MPGSLHAYPHADSSLLQVSIEFLCLSITVVQFLFTTLTSLFYKKCHLLKARVVIYAYNHHVRLLSPEPLVVKQPQFTRVEEPTLLCNHLGAGPSSQSVCDNGHSPRRLPTDFLIGSNTRQQHAAVQQKLHFFFRRGFTLPSNASRIASGRG